MKDEPQHTCGECGWAYDFHEIGADGKPFLLRCPYYTNGQYCRFVSDKQCSNFKPREDGKTN